MKGTATATTFTKIWENIRPDLRERVQGVKDTPILFKGAKICLYVVLYSALLSSMLMFYFLLDLAAISVVQHSV